MPITTKHFNAKYEQNTLNISKLIIIIFVTKLTPFIDHSILKVSQIQHPSRLPIHFTGATLSALL